MTIEKLFAYVAGVKPHAFSPEVLLRWLSECEGMIQTEIYLQAPADVIVYESVDATKYVKVEVTSDPDHPGDRTRDSVSLTVRDMTGERVLNETTSDLACGESAEFLLFVRDGSTVTSKTVEASRKAEDDEDAGKVYLSYAVGSAEPTVTEVTPGTSQTAFGLCPIELLVPAPYDRMYYAYLEAMIDWQEGEYAGYANTLERFNREWAEYSVFVGERIRPGLGHAEVAGYYLSAYAIAVKHGYEGTEEEWLASLKGTPGKPGAKGDPGDPGEDGNIIDVGTQVDREHTTSYLTGHNPGDLYINDSTWDVFVVNADDDEWILKGNIAAPKPKRGTLTLSASWTAGTGVYTQSVSITGATANSQIDLCCDADVIAQMVTDEVPALYIENNAGVLSAVCVGNALTSSVTVQYVMVETEAAS